MTTPLVRYVPPASTLEVGDNAVDFGRSVLRYAVRNKSGRTIHVEPDATASPESTAVVHGRTMVADETAAALHIYVTAQSSLDDVGLGEIEVAGWAPFLVPEVGGLDCEIVRMDDDLTLDHANVFVVCSNAAISAQKTLTLPPAGACIGQWVHTMSPGGNSPHVVAQAPDHLLGSECSLQCLSDGLDWYGMDC